MTAKKLDYAAILKEMEEVRPPELLVGDAYVRRESDKMSAAAPVFDERAVENPASWPDPTPEMLKLPQFEAIWQCIKDWDINVPHAYSGYCGATGNHVRAILDALGDLR